MQAILRIDENNPIRVELGDDSDLTVQDKRNIALFLISNTCGIAAIPEKRLDKILDEFSKPSRLNKSK